MGKKGDFEYSKVINRNQSPISTVPWVRKNRTIWGPPVVAKFLLLIYTPCTDIIQKGGGFSPMKILSRGGNWQTGLASRTILLQLFCDCPAVAPLHSEDCTLVDHNVMEL